jgi:sucrose phosphorylase
VQSEWADLFIRYNKFWGGEPSESDLSLIYTRKPRPPFLEVEHADGTKQKVWCTFDYEQVDIDAFSPLGSKFIEDQLAALCAHGCGLIRLDAFGYTTKRKGTNCFFVEPEVRSGSGLCFGGAAVTQHMGHACPSERCSG